MMGKGWDVLGGSKMQQNPVVCWQMEFPVIDVIVFKATCNPGVGKYHICESFYVTGNQDVIRLILFFCVIHGVKRTNKHVTDGVSQEHIPDNNIVGNNIFLIPEEAMLKTW